VTRRKLRKPCEPAGKASYRDRESALRLGATVLRAHLQSEAGQHHTIDGLWVYPCSYVRGAHWHLTSKDQHDETVRVKLA